MGLPPWDYDLYIEERFEARDHFMLMPTQKRQLRSRRAIKDENEERMDKRMERSRLLNGLTDDLDKIHSLLQLPPRPSSKTADGTLERLGNDCLIKIMHHSRLEPDLWNLLGVSGRCRAIWEDTERSILVGMQEEKFSDYIEMFGKIGSQSEKQLYNLRSALATDAWKLRAETYEPEVSFVDLRKNNVKLYERSLILYLESTNDYFNDRVQLLHELGSFESCTQHVTKSAVLALWRIGWSRRENREWKPAGSRGSTFMVDTVRKILGQQPDLVRLRIRDILHKLAGKIDQTLRLSSHMKPQVEDLEALMRQGRTRSVYDVSQWHEEAVNATIVMEIAFRGIGGAIDYVKEIDSENDAADKWGRVQCPRLLQSIRISRVSYDLEMALEDMDLRNLKNHVKIARELGVSIFGKL